MAILLFRLSFINQVFTVVFYVIIMPLEWQGNYYRHKYYIFTYIRKAGKAVLGQPGF